MNSQYFTQEQIKAGQMQKLLDFLMSEAYAEGDHYNDIHIRPEDCGAFVVEWVQVPWSHDYGGRFEYVDEEHVIMLERQYPDGSYGEFYDENDYEQVLADWLKDNPGWTKDSFGRWTNKNEANDLQSYLENKLKETKDSEIHYENGVPQGDYHD